MTDSPYNQRRSLWDEIHPGRPWAARLQPAARSAADILEIVKNFLAGPIA